MLRCDRPGESDDLLEAVEGTGLSQSSGIRFKGRRPPLAEFGVAIVEVF